MSALRQDPQANEPSTDTSAGRKIGFWTCTALVVGNTIGMGIFVLPASLAPFGFNATIGWGITILGCVALAQVFARLARELPRADGPYGYIRATLGEVPAYIAIWCYWVSLWITNAALAIGVVGYFTAVFPELKAVPPAAFALGLVWLFVGICLFGVRSGGGVQIVTTALKLLPIIAVTALGGWLLLFEPSAYVAHLPTQTVALPEIMTASTIALFAMLGLESATVPATTVADPARTIPRATLAGTVLVAVVYLIVSTVPMLLLDQSELANSSAPFALLMDRFVGAGLGRWLALFVVISGLGALNGWTLLTGELTQTMAANGVLPKALTQRNARGAPVRALLMTGVLASAMVAMSYSKSLVAGFTFLSTVVTAANMPLYLCCALAILMLWRRGVAPARRGMLTMALLGAAYVIFAVVGLGQEAFLMALGLGIAGLPIYAWMRWRAAR